MSEGGALPDEPSIFGDEDEGSGKGVIRIASVAALGGLLFGYDSAVINGAVDAIQVKFDVSAGVLGFAVASALLGAAAGAMTAGRIADRLGRLRVMQIAAILFLISALGTGFSPNLEILVLFRIIGGVAIGVASVIAPAYIAETSPARIRGRLGSLQQLAIVLGIFLSLLVDYLFVQLVPQSTIDAADAKVDGENMKAAMDLATSKGLTPPAMTSSPDAVRDFISQHGGTAVKYLPHAVMDVGPLEAWQWMFLAMAIPAILYGALALTIPESPRFLISQQRIPEARAVLERLLGEQNLEITINRIRSSLNTETKPSWKDLKRPAGGIYPVVWVGLLLSIFQQAVGINVIFYYSNILWQAVGFKESQSFQISVATSIVNVLVTIVAIALVDRIGRKPLLLIGSGGMFVTLGVMAACFGTATVVDGNPKLDGAAGPIALVAANLFVIFFGVSWGPVVWVLLGEMFPNRFRAAALSVAAAGQWAANWAITVSFPPLKDFSLGVAYGMYSLFALLSLLFVSRFVQETKGKSLEDMDAMAGIVDEPAPKAG
ncbi:sugar porter family MFS transporter [Gordonia sp. TBRC 11910]|uniref:Sugar porter family MFS transporter n=1 Tax=Gordonia asplenii TaxID=2725283 RepID=A0A848KT77_9ACTN|nr:MFS transporter [Gordonia asplenii]NMO01369.1 sugar porter family MFS transporter [Gordonia asplenii]